MAPDSITTTAKGGIQSERSPFAWQGEKKWLFPTLEKQEKGQKVLVFSRFFCSCQSSGDCLGPKHSRRRERHNQCVIYLVPTPCQTCRATGTHIFISTLQAVFMLGTVLTTLPSHSQSMHPQSSLAGLYIISAILQIRKLREGKVSSFAQDLIHEHFEGIRLSKIKQTEKKQEVKNATVS